MKLSYSISYLRRSWMQDQIMNTGLRTINLGSFRREYRKCVNAWKPRSQQISFLFYAVNVQNSLISNK